MEPIGIKKNSNGNIFLNSINDLTRSAYSNNTKASELSNKPINRFDSDILLNSKESFESNNQKLNSLQEEILSLKRKLSIIPEKDEEIHSLKCDIEKLNDQSTLNGVLSSENNKLKDENKSIRDNFDRLQLENMNNQTLQQENNMLKQKIKDLYKQLNTSSDSSSKTDIDIEDIMRDDLELDLETDIKIDNSREISEKIPVNIIELKQILSNRLRSYHEKHIDNLIDTYNLHDKATIEKNIMEKLLFDAIHI